MVPGVMTKSVINGFEVIQVGHDDGQRNLVPLSKGDDAAQALQKDAPVGDASQRVSVQQGDDSVLSYPQAVKPNKNSPQAQKPKDAMPPPEAHESLRPPLGQVPPKW